MRPDPSGNNWELGDAVQMQLPLGVWVDAKVLGHDEDGRARVKIPWHPGTFAPKPRRLRRAHRQLPAQPCQCITAWSDEVDGLLTIRHPSCSQH